MGWGGVQTTQVGGMGATPQIGNVHPSTPRHHNPLPPIPSSNHPSLLTPSSIATGTTLTDDRTPSTTRKAWFNKAAKQVSESTALGSGSGLGDANKEGSRLKHNFQVLTILGFARCGHCGGKMWGSQLRCGSKSSLFFLVPWFLLFGATELILLPCLNFFLVCHVGLHNRCLSSFTTVCPGEPRTREDTASPAPLREFYLLFSLHFICVFRCG